MRKLADALAAMAAEHRLNPIATAAIRLLLLSGCRKAEILSLRWEWVDVERGCLRLPDSKTGAKVVTLAAAAVKVAERAHRAAARSYCLPRWARATIPACKRIGSGCASAPAWPGCGVHDLRHSFASFAVADGNSLFLIGKVLGHKQARTTEIYAHLADDPIRAVADRTAARIAAAMTPGAERDPAAANVVPLRGGRP